MKYTKESFYKECKFHQIRRVSQVNVKACSNLEELVFTDDYVNHQKHRKDPRTYRLSNGWGETFVQPDDAEYQATLYVYQDSSMEDLEFFSDGDEYFLAGPVLERDAAAPDRRYTIYSTGGLLTRLMPGTLEKQGISCMHATSVYNPEKNHMMVFIGGPGAGKTILMLESTLRRGYRLMTTEYTHFKTVGDDVFFYIGCPNGQAPILFGQKKQDVSPKRKIPRQCVRGAIWKSMSRSAGRKRQAGKFAVSMLSYTTLIIPLPMPM